MNFSRKINRLANELYKTVKPYTQQLDDGKLLTDAMSKQMIEDAENFKYNHVEFSGSGFYPLPSYHDRTEIDRTTFTIILNMMYLVAQWAEIEKKTPKQDDTKQIDIKEAAHPKQASGQNDVS